VRPNIPLLVHNRLEVVRLEGEREKFEKEKLVDVSRRNKNLFEHLNNEVPQYIDANAEKREKIDAEIKRLRTQIEFEMRKADNTTITTDIEKITRWDPYDQNAKASGFFDADWMFGIKDGFDVVIGNPPYVQVPKGIFSAEQFPFSEGKDKGKQNLYKVFVENSYNLAKDNFGIATMIVQSSLMADLSSQHTRELLLTKTQLKEVIEFPKKSENTGGQVFKSVLQGTCIYQFKKKVPGSAACFNVSIGNDVTTINKLEYETLQQNELIKFYPNGYFIPLVKPNEFPIIRKMQINTFPLRDVIIEKSQGDFNLSTERRQYSTSLTTVKLLRGDHIHRYYVNYNVNEFVNNNFLQVKVNHNSTIRYLVRQQITGTTDKQRLHFALTDNNEKFLCGHSVGKISIEETCQNFLLGILNSKLLDWYFRKTSTNNNVNGYEVEQLPIPLVSAQQQQPVIARAGKILAAKAADPQADTSALEREIDALVYRLYNLSYDEVKVIEPDCALDRGAWR
jgi:hypothetical protein